MTIRILLADDHPGFRAGIRTELEKELDMTVVGEAASGKAADALVTVGQRRGLGVAVGEPRYVVRIEPSTSTFVSHTPSVSRSIFVSQAHGMAGGAAPNSASVARTSL